MEMKALPVTPSLQEYQENEKRFSADGFTRKVFEDLFPILQVSTWDAYWLFCLGRKVPDGGRILEIGSGRGGSISCFAAGMGGKNIAFTAIDPFCEYDEERGGVTHRGVKEGDIELFRKNTEKRGIEVKLIRKFSDEAVSEIGDESCDLVFIDSNHSYEYVKRDILNYLPKVKRNGIFLGHDYNPGFDGVIRAVREIFGDMYEIMENSNIYLVRR